MSLINDALKRAKQAQQEAAESPAPVPHLRPVEPSQESARHGLGLAVPIGLAVIALLGLMLFWVLWKKEGSVAPATNRPALSVAARTPAAEPVSTPAAAPTTTPDSSAPAPDVRPSIPEPAVASSNGSTTNPAAATSESTDSNHVATIESAPPTPPPLKLQSIVYNPRSPSAMINGRVVFVGDRMRDLRVVAIHRDDVVLIGGGRTNLLSLEP